jgi:rhodanese-related sulfurtransferase
MQRIKHVPILLLCLLVLGLASACTGAAAPVTTPTATPKPLGDQDMKAILRDFLANLPPDWNLIASQDVAKTKPVVIDVRQPDEYTQGFIEGAVNIPLRELARNLQALPALDKDIVVVCSTGHRAAIGMAVLQMLGYKKAKTLDGGLNAWRAAKLPVVTTPVPPRPTGPAPKVDAQVQAMLEYYLVHTLPFDWGVIDLAGLTDDQKRKSSAEIEIQPETFDQGPSLLVDVDEPEEFAKANLDPTKSINAPLRRLPDSLDNIPLQEAINWA